MIGKEPRPFGCRALRACDRRGIGHRLQLRQPFLARGRDPQAGDNSGNPIEFKGPKGAGVHWRNQKRERRPSSLANRQTRGMAAAGPPEGGHYD